MLVISKDITAQRVAIAQGFEASNNAAYGNGSFIDAVIENTRVMTFFYDNPLSLWSTFGWWVMLGLTMLIGLLAGRRCWVATSG